MAVGVAVTEVGQESESGAEMRGLWCASTPWNDEDAWTQRRGEETAGISQTDSWFGKLWV